MNKEYLAPETVIVELSVANSILQESNGISTADWKYDPDEI
jgi:hypothetical protein